MWLKNCLEGEDEVDVAEEAAECFSESLELREFNDC
jgi:hypothetical protein